MLGNYYYYYYRTETKTLYWVGQGASIPPRAMNQNFPPPPRLSFLLPPIPYRPIFPQIKMGNSFPPTFSMNYPDSWLLWSGRPCVGRWIGQWVGGTFNVTETYQDTIPVMSSS